MPVDQVRNMDEVAHASPVGSGIVSAVDFDIESLQVQLPSRP